MVVAVGVDAGNDNVKTVGEKGTDIFPSALGEPHDRKLRNEPSKDDMIVEFKGTKYFAGSLAGESDLSSSTKELSKANEEVLIRVLLALVRHSKDTDFDIIVGQPIKSHSDDEKEKIIKMLQGEHTIKVNGTTRVIHIRNVRVAAEGASVGLLSPVKGKYHILDVGSGTINWATVTYDGERVRFSDKGSNTETFGMSTLRTDDVEFITRKVCGSIGSRWEKRNPVRIVGAAAREFLEPVRKYFPNAVVFEPNVNSKMLDPVYANAAAFYAIARTIYGKKG